MSRYKVILEGGPFYGYEVLSNSDKLMIDVVPVGSRLKVGKRQATYVNSGSKDDQNRMIFKHE